MDFGDVLIIKFILLFVDYVLVVGDVVIICVGEGDRLQIFQGMGTGRGGGVRFIVCRVVVVDDREEVVGGDLGRVFFGEEGAQVEVFEREGDVVVDFE